MDALDFLGYGFSIALQPINLFYCLLGVFIGTLTGVLPGIGPVGAISLLLPTTYGISPVSAVIMLSGIYYGAQYGGSTTSILLNIPGEASSVVTTLDGYKMAQNGEAGPALGIAAFGSFIAGTISVILLMLLAAPLVKVALRFGPPEYFSCMILGLTLISYLTQGSALRGFISAVLGFILCQIGLDVVTTQPRMTFGIMNLEDGLGLVPVVMGLFGLSEILINLDEVGDFEIVKGKIKNIFPTRKDWKDSIGAIFRGTLSGFFLGILPGGGAVIASFVAYALEKKISKHPEKFGNGAIEGVAAPESANNAAAGGAFVPLFTLGIPANVAMAMLFGALMIHGLTPGPMLLKDHPEIFWGTITSMYLGNVLLLILNLPFIGLWVKLLQIPYRLLFPFILLFCIIGSYSLQNSMFDVLIMVIFGVVGYLFRKIGFETAPMILSFVLGPLLENSLRQSLVISEGSLLIFIQHSISGVVLLVAFIMILSAVIPFARIFALIKKN